MVDLYYFYLHFFQKIKIFVKRVTVKEVMGLVVLVPVDQGQQVQGGRKDMVLMRLRKVMRMTLPTSRSLRERILMGLIVKRMMIMADLKRRKK